jgi:DNA modification methylase
MKPVELVANCLKDCTKEGMFVLDAFGGSGTTLIACEQLNRKCYMMELDPHYCDVIIARWEKLTGKQARRID